MNLYYFGTGYDVLLTIEATEAEIVGQFPKTSWRCQTLTERFYFQPTYLSRYQGAVFIAESHLDASPVLSQALNQKAMVQSES